MTLSVSSGFGARSWRWAPLFFIVMTMVFGAAITQAAEIPVKVDPRVELMSIIFRLAGNPEYNQGQVAAYESDIGAFFGDVKDHPAVVLARKLREENGIGYGAVMALAVHVTNPPELVELVALDPLPSGLGSRWTPSTARNFLDAARRFASESHFMVFYSDQQGFYDLTTNRMTIAMDNQSVGPWTQAFFGTEPNVAYSVILGLANGAPTYSPQVIAAGRPTGYFSIVGVGQTDSAGMPEFSLDALQPVMHDYLVAILAARPEAEVARFSGPGKDLYAAVEPIMKGLGYNDGRALVTESLVRAITIRWLAAGPEKDLVPRAVDYQQKMGFYWLDGLNDLLAGYETQRSQYGTFGMFVPRLATYLADYAKDVDARIDAVEAGWTN